MQMQDNPLLQQEDFMKPYQDNIEKLKDKPDALLFEKLCYELFAGNDSGKKFMEIVIERYLIAPLADKSNPNYALMVIWSEGFKDAFRLLRQCVTSHDQRIKAGAKA